ncbi:LysR family transcriptional regulator [Achromobacter xylosoxidans]|uniref:LysR family transcriptional regulator n=1 Tax=Alcaligenes xylosoxydans xylosoxydans TaxID=85698 RepID=UPI0006BFE5D2|nr:LysR substrate-binding domain-containing protein [Achromobacter xylosoxidans]CUJ53138.1 Hca operon transcriptional activator [Achromobacter xylosoxidans]
MDIRHLRYFLALAEELHFGRAAERAHIEQSPLSRTISQLEDELGVPLFIRSRQGTTLTPAGEALREPAREILTAIEQARRKVAAVGGLPAVLRIGLSDGLVQPRLSVLFRRWQEQSAVRLDIRELPSGGQEAALRTEQLDIGLSFGVPPSEHLLAEPVWRDPLVAAVPRDHALAQVPALALDAIASLPLILCHPRYKPGWYAQVDALLQAAGIAPASIDLVESLAGMIVKVGAGCGLGFIDSAHAQTLSRPDVAMVPLADVAAQVTTYALRKAGRQDDLTETMAQFLALACRIA